MRPEDVLFLFVVGSLLLLLLFDSVVVMTVTRIVLERPSWHLAQEGVEEGEGGEGVLGIYHCYSQR